ncbi:unnamed protein product [Durusdinium trenchii]|uniref:Uncharacterized protein n=1 Tax=Durusdinium trenchii TaxID=1381693 RepID=A0ABP0SBC5_9DINO
MCEVEGGFGPVPPGAIADGGIRKGPEDGEPPEEGLAHIQLPVKSALDLKQERLVGTVTKYLPVSGYGMVKSHMFEGELTFRIDRVMPEFQAHPLHENEGVEFDVQADETGKPVAVAVKPVLGRKPYDVLGQRHRGYVRRFAERWGFLNAAAFDGDLFVHRDNLLLEPGTETGADGQPILRTGQVVEFDVALDDRGRAVAKQITTRALLRPGDWIGHRLRGYIRSFQGAWGFINSDRFAGDLFVHRDSLLAACQNAQLAIGTVVEFDIERDHHRKGAKNRLVARNVSVLPGEAPVQLPPLIPGQHPVPLDPAAAPFGAPGTPHGAEAQQASSMYYQAPPVQDPALSYGVPPYTYPPPTQTPQTPQGQQTYSYPPQSPYYSSYAPYAPYGVPYGQPPYANTPYPPYGGNPYGQYGAYGPHGGLAYPESGDAGASEAGTEEKAMFAEAAGAVPKVADGVPAIAPQTNGEERPAPAPVATAAPGAATAPSPPTAPPGATAATPPAATPAVATSGAAQEYQAPTAPGLLHITIHDWEPDQPGQLFVTKGTLVNISYRAAHGWVYAGTVQPGSESAPPASEGWIPQAVVKRVSLCRVAVDWPAEGQATLGVTKGEIIAVSKEAERGWVYGERLGGDRPSDKLCDGWLPKKVLDYIQA